MSKDELSQKSIHELRILGKKIGVKRAYMLKKNDLIQSILDIYSGTTQPFFSNRGRKPYIKNTSKIAIDTEKLYLIENLLDKTKKEILDILKG